MSDLVEIPDVAGEIIAWRVWRWNGESLLSMTTDERWPPNAWMVARCDTVGRLGAHSAPHPGCTCGIYAMSSRGTLFAQHRYHRLSDAIWGQVALAGRVVCAERGYRAERARPLSAFATYDDWHKLRALRDVYGLEVRLLRFTEDADELGETA